MLRLLERVREWWQTRRTNQITAKNARERVQRGAEYLDDVDPEWYRDVDAETLELGDGRHCILGQLHGEFRLGLSRSHLISMSSAPRASLSPVAYGFKCVEGVPEKWQTRDYMLLNEAWKEAVSSRQEAERTACNGLPVSSGDSMPKASIELSASESSPA